MKGSTRLASYQAANGCPRAKARIEAAGLTVTQLTAGGARVNDRAPAVARAPAPAPRPAAAAPVAAPVVPSVTKADVDLAFARGIAQERARVAKVFGLAASQGRERVCADLLMSDTAFSADKIARHLEHMPTDRERAGSVATEARQAKVETIISAQRGPDPREPNDTAKRLLAAKRGESDKPAISANAQSKAAQIIAAQRAMGSRFVKDN